MRAAVELLDAEGLNALSMRRLGAKLGSGATSIYWHVANKDELLELVLDEFYGEFKLLETQETTDWRHAATLFAYGMREALFRHPWAMPLVGTMPAVGPNAMRLMSRLNGTFARAGFQDFERDYAASTLLSYVAGITVPEISPAERAGRIGHDHRRVARDHAADGGKGRGRLSRTARPLCRDRHQHLHSPRLRIRPELHPRRP